MLFRSAAQQRGVAEGDIAEVAAMAPTVAIGLDPDTGTVTVDGVDATRQIRSREVTEAVSQISANQAVRAELVRRQRAWVAERGGAVVEGRDIGSVVFPDAEAKFFLTASAEVRAERRRAELEAAGQAVDLQQVLEEVRERDRRDSERPIAPLKRAPDAILIDSSHLTIDEAVKEIVRRVREVAGAEPGSEGGEAR